MYNKKRNTNNSITKKKDKPAKKVHKAQTIEYALKRAAQGRKCPLCGKQLANAVYQRHFEKCELREDDDDVIFCETIEADETTRNNRKNMFATLKREKISVTPLSASLRKSVMVTKKVFNNGSPRANLGPSTLSADDCLAELQRFDSNCKENEPDAGSKFDDDLFLSEVYDECLKQLKKYNEEHEFGQPAKKAVSCEQTCSSSQIPPPNLEEDGQREEFNNNSVHYSLRFLWKILHKVLLCPEHENSAEIALKFWGDPPLRALLGFLTTSVKAQQLFAHLLIRRWGWHIARDIKYKDLGEHQLAPLFAELRANGLMEDAFSSGTISIEEALKQIPLEDMKPLCKLLKVESGIGRKAIQKEFQKYAAQKNVLGHSNKWNLFRCIKSQIGECFRVRANVLDLFTAFLTIYSPNLMDTKLLIDQYQQKELSSQLFFTMLQHQNGEVTFMGPVSLPHSLVRLYSNHSALMDYIGAKNGEQMMRRLMDKHAFEKAWELAKSLKATFTEQFFEGENPRIRHYMEMPVYLRPFTPPWVYCRCIFYGVEAAQRNRNYEEAVEWLRFLVEKEEIKHFCVNSRGNWYQRLALNLESHLKKQELAADACLAGIQDPLVAAKDKLALQIRAEKLSVRLDWPIHGQTPIQLVEPPEKVHIEGKIIGKGLGDGKQVNHFYMPSNSDSNESSSSSRADINKCTVEELALWHFLQKEGFEEGIHSEGGIWHSLFRLFFHDIIFTPHMDSASDVWISPLQSDPLDLNYSEFYENRRRLIEDRLAQMLASPAFIIGDHFVNLNFDRLSAQGASSNSVIGWHRFNDKEQLLRFIRCCPTRLLHDLLKRLCTDFRGTRSGFPDLTVWNATTRQLAVVEVKGPNDQLSTKQQLWLDFFQSRGVRAVVCHVSAKNDRALE